MVLIKPKIGSSLERITGNTCGKQEYTDWPCLEADGCIVLSEESLAGNQINGNDQSQLLNYLLDKSSLEKSD